jgi:hypothetical protein
MFMVSWKTEEELEKKLREVCWNPRELDSVQNTKTNLRRTLVEILEN